MSAVFLVRVKVRFGGKTSSKLDELLTPGRLETLGVRFSAYTFRFVFGVIGRDFLRLASTRGNSEGTMKAISVRMSA